ncbi:MAG: InlB B-repeat-containing protein [bacterium]
MRKTLAFMFVLVLSLTLIGCSNEKTYNLKVDVEGKGTVEPDGGEFAGGTLVELEPKPVEGWELVGWKGEQGKDVVKENNIWKIVMNEDKNIVADFFPDWISDVDLSEEVIYLDENSEIRVEILVDCLREELKKIDEEKEWEKESPVKVLKEDSESKWEFIGYLFDSGNLDDHGNEVRGDRHYSNIINFAVDKAGKYNYKVVITDKSGKKFEVFFEIEVIEKNKEKVQKIIDTHNSAKEELKEIVKQEGANVEENLIELKNWLEDMEGIKKVIKSDYYLEILYDIGVTSFIMVTDEEYRSSAVREEKTIPLKDQKRGNTVESMRNYSGNISKKENAEYVGNRRVLLWAPYCSEFSPFCEASEIEDDLEDANLGYDITMTTDSNADLAVLEDMYNYGVIIFTTHGLNQSLVEDNYAEDIDEGPWIITNEVVEDLTEYQYEIENHYMIIASMVSLEDIEDPSQYEDVYMVGPTWFDRNIDEDFSNSIIYANSCYSGVNNNLWKIFEDKEAGAFLGWDDAVNSNFAYNRSIEFVEEINDGQTTIGEAYEEQTGPAGAAWKFWGNEDLKIPPGLLNGDFSDSISGWTPGGDGRVISGLGNISPLSEGQMGIISTGLGYTDKYGSIEQSFYLDDEETTITFEWNYLSEEFLNYIGSIYQDPFRVTINGDTVLYRTVDNIADNFEADPENSGSLISVSPEISFDQGDVFKTDWQKSEHDISEYQGQVITLKFEAVDEGDDIFDTAVLIDNIQVE